MTWIGKISLPEKLLFNYITMEDPTKKSPLAVNKAPGSIREVHDAIQKELYKEMDSKFQECLALAKTDSQKADVKAIFKMYLSGSTLSNRSFVSIRTLTPENRKIMDERIKRVAEYAKLYITIADPQKTRTPDELGTLNVAEAWLQFLT
jgi:hypothetical protein